MKSSKQQGAEQKGQLAFNALLQGNNGYAADMFGQAINELRHMASEEIYYALCLDGFGQVRLNQLRFVEAEELFLEALSLYEKFFVTDLFGRFSVQCHLGLANSHQGLYDRARLFYERALAIGHISLENQPLVLVHGCLQGYADVLRKLSLEPDAELIEKRIKAILDSE